MSRFSVLLALSFLGAGVSRADIPLASPGGAILSPAGGERLEAGSHQSVAWRLGPDEEVRGPDEMELFLSVDGGASFVVRVTASFDSGRRRWEWRVPALPTEHARLLLRTGIEERSELEHAAAFSAEFAIVNFGQVPLEELFRVGAELRTRDALEAAFVPGSINTSSDTQLSSPEHHETAAETARPAASPSRSSTFASCVRAPASRDLARRAPLISGPPIRVHLRE